MQEAGSRRAGPIGRRLWYGAISLGLLLPRLARLLRRLVPRDYLALVLQALSGNLVYYMLLALGVKLAGVAPTSLIIGLVPVALTLLGRCDQGAVPLRRMALPLLLVAVAIGCINVDALASGLIALPIGLVSMLLTQGAEALPAAERDWTLSWTYNGLLALGASVIGNGLWNIASRRLSVTLTGQLILFETVAAMLYGFVYRGAPPRILEIVAIGLLVLGVTWSVRLHAAMPPERVVVA